MTDAAQRPFYDGYAWAYDFLINPPGEERVDFIADAFAQRAASRLVLLADKLT